MAIYNSELNLTTDYSSSKDSSILEIAQHQQDDSFRLTSNALLEFEN